MIHHKSCIPEEGEVSHGEENEENDWRDEEHREE